MKRKKKSVNKAKSSGIDIVSLSILSFFIIVILAGIVYQIYNTTPKSLWINKNKALSNEQVCMVNDVYLGKKQIPVPVEGKIYYGCCKDCVSKLQNKREFRYAIDPYSGDSVDKAKAFIVLRSKVSDLVWYFESEENYKLFMATE